MRAPRCTHKGGPPHPRGRIFETRRTQETAETLRTIVVVLSVGGAAMKNDDATNDDNAVVVHCGATTTDDDRRRMNVAAPTNKRTTATTNFTTSLYVSIPPFLDVEFPYRDIYRTHKHHTNIVFYNQDIESPIQTIHLRKTKYPE